MIFNIVSVATVDENVGYRMIGRLEAETQEDREFLPTMCECMQDVLDTFAEDVQPEVGEYKDGNKVVKTIYYRAISLPEVKFVLGVFNNRLPFKTTVDLAVDAKMYPEDIAGIFKFQLQCFKQQNDL